MVGKLKHRNHRVFCRAIYGLERTEIWQEPIKIPALRDGAGFYLEGQNGDRSV